MEDRKWLKWSWLLCLLILSLTITPVVIAQEDEEGDEEEDATDQDTGSWIVVKGKGSTQEGAIVNAWVAAMNQFLKKNISSEDYNANVSKIESFAGENWRNYAKGDPDKPKVIKKYYNRTITIKVRLEEERLLKDIQDRFTKARGKLEGMEVALLSDTEPDKANKDEWMDRDVLFDNVQDPLGQFMTVRSLKALKELMQAEAQSTGRTAFTDPGSFVQQKFDGVKVLIYLWLSTTKFADPMQGCDVWIAQVGCRGVWRQDAQELWHFQIKSGDATKSWKTAPVSAGVIGDREARSRAIKDVAKAVAEKIDFEVRTRLTVLQEEVYFLKFVGFNSSQRDKVEEAIADLSEGKKPPLKLEKGGGSAGTDYFTLKVKWLRGGGQAKLIRVVKETCANNQVNVESVKSSPGMIYFQPAKVTDEG